MLPELINLQRPQIAIANPELDTMQLLTLGKQKNNRLYQLYRRTHLHCMWQEFSGDLTEVSKVHPYDICNLQKAQCHHILSGTARTDEWWNYYPLCSKHHWHYHHRIKKNRELELRVRMSLLHHKIIMGEATVADILYAQGRFTFRYFPKPKTLTRRQDV